MVQFRSKLKLIKCLKPLLSWANLCLQLWSNKFTYEESLIMTIKDAINKSSPESNSYIMKKFTKFQEAWNNFAKTNTTLLDGCDPVQINVLTEESLFQYCCITNTQKESLGYHFYLLMRHAALLQNQFLKKAHGKKPKQLQAVELMKLSSY